MRRIKLVLEYEGTDFCGYQSQKNEAREPTIQGAVERALELMLEVPTSVLGASRTDAGVHARGQVVVFDTDRAQIPVHGFRMGLNAQLPDGIRIQHAEEVPLDFNPKRHSRGKRYRYRFLVTRERSALLRRTTWHVGPEFALERAREAANAFLGAHDFEAFRAQGCVARHARRTMYAAEVHAGDYGQIYFDITGNAFVRNMVRIMAGTVKEVACGRRAPSSVALALSSRRRADAGETAPARGLCLEEVIFDARLPEREPAWDAPLEGN